MNVIEIRRIKEAIELLNMAIRNNSDNLKEIKKSKYILEDLIEFKDFTIDRDSLK